MRRSGTVVLLLLACAACSGRGIDLSVQAPATLPGEPGGHEEAVVTRVIDGDTVEVRMTGRVAGPGAGAARPGGLYDVRLIGIDTPESVSPREPVECFAREASAALEVLVAGRVVMLVKDVEETDRYARLLRYVYLGEEMVGARLVANGYAHAYTYPPNVRHAALLVALQRDARIHDRGLWAPDTCAGEP
jgi:micrococcal nuclease